MAKKVKTFDPGAFLASIGIGRKSEKFKRGKAIFRQGDEADAVYYIDKGKVNITVASKQGKEGVIAILEPGEFFGEGCLAGQPVHMATAAALSDAVVLRIEKETMIRLLRDQPDFSQLFMGFLLSRNVQIEADLVDQLFNSSEKRLARVLLLLAHFGKEGKMEPVIPKISQDLLAARVGTTRSRINYFMNKFRKLGFIEYNGTLKVNSALLNVIVHD
ncbi:Crp/Fnr family transcriptional regulator [Dongia sedimenti]|uniref:Crp/Fnr family transcriptional regulator n=1 Tax=Dongia sedimenti TaxID=3064282 RepID=A0ABU0YQC9_9PROT|nr:Crp/Fnr family transcriptional regulator [Rhodospirillaceae bacterium R-7]